jgi:hypothetical protein
MSAPLTFWTDEILPSAELVRAWSGSAALAV